MTTMPQVRIHGVDDVRVDTVDRPAVGTDDVLIEVGLCGICGSDLGYVAMGGLGLTHPMPLGHELVGTVAEVGANVAGLPVGQRVVVNPMGGGNSIGNGGPEGGFAPYLLVRGAAGAAQSIYPVPTEFTAEQAAMVEPLSVALHGCHQGHASSADRALVFGAGPIGLCTLICLQYLGLEQVVVVDRCEQRLAVADGLGALTFTAGEEDLAAFLRDQRPAATSGQRARGGCSSS